MELVPLFGAEFNVYSPVIILIVGMLTFLNVYSRMLKMVGIENEDAITGSCTTCHKLDADDIELIAIGKKHVTSQMHLISDRNTTPSVRMMKEKNGELQVTTTSHVFAVSSDTTGIVENPLYGRSSLQPNAKRTTGIVLEKVQYHESFFLMIYHSSLE